MSFASDSLKKMIEEYYSDEATRELVLATLNLTGTDIDDLKVACMASFVAATVNTCEELGMKMAPNPIQLLVSLKVMMDNYENERAKLCQEALSKTSV